MYYIGSHLGSESDGYICSSKRMLAAYKLRPQDFKRRILEKIDDDHKSLLVAEQRWLDLINLQSGRYYNLKLHAAGGNGHANKGKSKKSWNKGLTKEILALRRDGLFMLLSDKPKTNLKYKNPSNIPHICPECQLSYRGRLKQIFCSASCKNSALSNRNKKGRICSEIQKKQISTSNKNRTAWNKGIPNSRASQLGKDSAEKQRATVIGRKREYRSDGTWYWKKKNSPETEVPRPFLEDSVDRLF